MPVWITPVFIVLANIATMPALAAVLPAQPPSDRGLEAVPSRAIPPQQQDRSLYAQAPQAMPEPAKPAVQQMDAAPQAKSAPAPADIKPTPEASTDKGTQEAKTDNANNQPKNAPPRVEQKLLQKEVGSDKGSKEASTDKDSKQATTKPTPEASTAKASTDKDTKQANSKPAPASNADTKPAPESRTTLKAKPPKNHEQAAEAGKKAPGKPAANTAATDDSEAPLPLTAAEKQQICVKQEGAFVTYYGSVYKVNKCKRYELSTDEIYELTKRSGKLSEVDNRTIQGLEFGGTYGKDFLTQDKTTPCKKFDRQYITYAVDVYWVERCIKRVFPDWASYESHRGKLGSGNSKLFFVSWQEFASLRNGRSMPSVIDEEFRELSETVDIIPIDEACKGVVGTYVTYFDHIYFIEANQTGKRAGVTACRKRELDGEDYTRRYGHRRFHLKELTSSQAVSIPDGTPVKTPPPKKAEQKKAGAAGSKATR